MTALAINATISFSVRLTQSAATTAVKIVLGMTNTSAAIVSKEPSDFKGVDKPAAKSSQPNVDGKITWQLKPAAHARMNLSKKSWLTLFAFVVDFGIFNFSFCVCFPFF